MGLLDKLASQTPPADPQPDAEPAIEPRSMSEYQHLLPEEPAPKEPNPDDPPSGGVPPIEECPF
jgi:hypothetical protein